MTIALALWGLSFDDASAGPPDPIPGPVVDITTKLQPYQTPGVKPSQSDDRSLKLAPSLPEEEEPPIGALAQQTFYAVADATVLQGYPTQNLGNTTDMWAGYDENLEPDGQIARSLVRFDLASLPPHQSITTATLRVYLVTSWDYPNTSRSVTTYRVTSSWSEGSVTWDDSPGYDGSAYGSRSIVHGAWGWYEFDVTNLVRAWYSGTDANYGVMLRGPEVSGSNASWRGFGTRESSYSPQLVIGYTNTSPALTGLPDQTLTANTIRDNAIDLWAYASDAESSDSALTFTIANTPAASAGVTIDSNRYIDIRPTTDWTGQTDVTIRVADPGGLFAADTFRVYIIAPNSAPTLTGLPDQTLMVNTNLDNAIDLWTYASDAESSDSALTFTITNTPDPNAGVSIDANRYIDIRPTTDWTGQTDVTIRVADPGGLFAGDTFVIKVSLPVARTIYLPIILGNAEPPSPPVLNSIDNSDGDGDYTVSWSSVNGATRYVLQEADNPSFSSPTTVYSGPSASTTVSGRSVGTYYYQVQATNSSGSSPWSNAVSVQVSAQDSVVPKPGYWSGSQVSFEVSTDSKTVHDFTIEVYISGCGTYELVGNDMAISNGGFSGGSVSGTFSTSTSASGKYSYFFEACNGWTLGTGSWTATWRH
jgi:hypothetical protein